LPFFYVIATAIVAITTVIVPVVVLQGVLITTTKVVTIAIVAVTKLVRMRNDDLLDLFEVRKYFIIYFVYFLTK
jgi:hypothetical protein